jgi:hypothetical protein
MGLDQADRYRDLLAVWRMSEKAPTARGLLESPPIFLVASIAPGPTPSLDVADEASGHQSRYICPYPSIVAVCPHKSRPGARPTAPTRRGVGGAM